MYVLADNGWLLLDLPDLQEAFRGLTLRLDSGSWHYEYHFDSPSTGTQKNEITGRTRMVCFHDGYELDLARWGDESLFSVPDSVHDIYRLTTSSFTTNSIALSCKACRQIGAAHGMGCLHLHGSTVFHGIQNFHRNQGTDEHKFWVYPEAIPIVDPAWDTHEEANAFCTNCRFVDKCKKGRSEYVCMGHEYNKSDGIDGLDDVVLDAQIGSISKEDEVEVVPDWKKAILVNLKGTPAPKKRAGKLAMKQNDRADALVDLHIVGFSCEMTNPQVWSSKDALLKIENICFEAIRKIFTARSVVVKEELCEDTFVETGLCGPIQVQMLKAFLKSCYGQWTSVDPAVEKKALQNYSHLMEWRDIQELKNTHNTVAGKFKNGPFAGTSVEDLTRHLLSGEVNAENLTPLVAVRFNSSPLYIVCGNRRIRALHDYAAELKKQSREPLPKVRVMIHTFPLDHIQDATVRCAFFAKAILAATTDNGGEQASFRWPRY